MGFDRAAIGASALGQHSHLCSMALAHHETKYPDWSGRRVGHRGRRVVG
jgi:hypothetical protein